ncbi:hypothetical protein Pelo_14906 [Pelomyxa schiedti]|nr:hypothetical protein Pelo_14906 [Pelomyxa schiedti]
MPRSPAFVVPAKPTTAATKGGAPATDVPAAVTPTATKDRQVTHCYVIAPVVEKKTKAINLDGSAMMNAGCAANGAPSVVLALTPEDVTSSTVKAVCRAASVLYGTYDKYRPDEGVEPARWSRYRSLILLNSSKKAPIFKNGDEALLSPLGISFTMHATKLVKSFGISTDSLKFLVSTIIETATAAKNSQGICRPVPLPIPSFDTRMIPLPVAGPIDITWMNHLTVRSLLELFSGDTYPLVLSSAIRAWVKAENWPAVKELCFSSYTHLLPIDLDSLELQDVPAQLEGISCGSLNLSHNSITKIPKWLLHPNANYRLHIISDLVDSLKQTFNSAVSVPRSWLRLEDYLRTSVKAKCGVARNTAKRSQEEEQEELRDCFEYLSDVGSIFHFRHNFSEDGCQSPSGKNEIVALDPSWFNDVMTTLTQATLTAVGAPTHMTSMEKMRVSAIRWPPGFDSRAVLDVLPKLGMIMDIGVQCSYLPFFLLPQTPFNYLKAFLETCNSKNGEVFTSGCILNFGFLPSEVFSSVIRSLCKGRGLQFFWRDGIVFSKQSSDVRNQESYLLITRVQHKVTQDTIVEVIMKTVCNKGEQASWKDNLMTTALNLFRRTVLTHKHPVSYSFPCPKCLEQHFLLSVTESAPLFQCIPDGSVRSLFFPKQIMEEALKGKDRMDCAVHPGVPIAEIAPSLFSLGFPSIITINAVQPGSNLITRCDCGGSRDGEQEGRPAVTLQPKTWCSDFALDTKAETKGVRNAQVLFSEITAQSGTPGHTNVVKFYGVALHGGTLLGLSEFLPPLSIPACLFPTTTPGPNPPESASLNQVISLHDLLKVCLQQPPNLETLNRVMPMVLRQRILRDVAEGLSHLHSQDPPIVHGGIDIEHVLITSLEATGPCAKITHPTIPWDNYAAPTNDVTSEEKTRLLDGRNRSPEVLNGYQASPKSDVWDFGILLHNLMAPLSYVALKSVTLSSIGNSGAEASSIPQPTTLLNSQSTGTTSTPSTATRTTTTEVSVPDSALTAASTSIRTPPPPPSVMKPGHTEVERFHVAPALSHGAFVVDTDRCDPATMPPWSLQLLSCCLVADPSARSPMSSLLRICDHFN